MQTSIRQYVFPLVVAGMLAGLHGTASAADTAPQSANPPAPAAPVQTQQIIGMGQAVSGGALDDLHAGDTGSGVRVLSDGQVTGNTAKDILSGDNAISGSAFSNAAGINTVIQNSGSNVLIQNGTAVNVQFVNPVP